MNAFFYGVIEGFYGRQWSWPDRIGYAKFMAEFGFNAYLYAPKAEAFLRSRWREPFPLTLSNHLKEAVLEYHKNDLRFGVGLSPMGLNENYSQHDSSDLAAKVEQLNELDVDIVCILFDDFQGNIEGLAQRQIAIVNDVAAMSTASHIIVCPSYYSFDPVLEKVFGKMPKNYLEDLGQDLAMDIDVFWTGNKVISTEYTSEDIARVSELLRRKPMLWDNYPVNDGRLTSNFINLKPYSGRPWQLENSTSGHFVNPMNQPELSKIVLQSLQSVYLHKGKYDLCSELKKNVSNVGDEKLAQQLMSDAARFQEQGLSAYSDAEKEQLQQTYASFNHPVAAEIVDWLAGGYEFDPDCLTE